MERKGTFLRAKLAKRIFVLFLAGALVPVTALALLSYHRLHGYMREQGTETLRYSAKEAGLAMLDRLRMAEIELALVADRLVRGVNVSLATEPAALDAPPRLGSIWQVGGATERILAGDPIEAPELSKEQLEHLAAGETALVIGYEPNNSVLLVRAMAQGRLERGTIWAEVNPPFLWASESTQLASSVVCVFNSVSTPLLCPPGVSNELWIRVSRMSSSLSNPGFEWEYGDFEYVSAVWQLFLAYDYEAPNWFVTWSQPKSDAFASITAFRTEMGLVFLLTLTLVFLIANVQVRTNLDPVVQLTAATRRVAAGDLEARVDIRSEDEFQELAESFNAMGSRLGQQFAMLETMSEIDRAVLSATDTRVVVHEFLTRSTAALGCQAASVVILSPGREPSRRFSSGPDGEIHQDSVILTEFEIGALRDVPEGLKIGAAAAARLSYLRPPQSRAGGDALWRVLPILLEEEPAGIVVLEYAGGEARELQGAHARNLTDQLGVAISNARLVERLDQLSWGTLAALARTMDAKSSWTAGHSERVTELAVSLGRRLDLSDEDIDLYGAHVIK